MSQSLVGNPSAVLKSEEPLWDPEYGYSTRQVWTGTKNAVLAKLAVFAASGFRASTSKITHGSWQCVGLVPISGEQPQIRYEIDVEWAQIDIFAKASVNAEMEAYGIPANYRKQIEDAASNGTALPADLAALALAPSVFKLIRRGAESYEIKRCVLRRKRSIPIDWATPIILDATEKVYTTASLVALFVIPVGIAAQLPPDPPSAPSETVWAWKARLDTSEFIPALNKLEEQKDWVFAAWSTLLYDVS